MYCNSAMTINDKIKQILIDKNLSPSYFADEIGVQRSSISHILSGRNRPSFDIIQKIIRRFPDLGYDWIMEEETGRPNNTVPSLPLSYGSRTAPQPTGTARGDRYGSTTTAGTTNSYGTASVETKSQRNEIAPSLPPSQSAQELIPALQTEPPPAAVITDKKIERILIFFSDGSFKDYLPIP